MARRTNLGLLLLLALAFATGTVGLALDSWVSRTALLAHAGVAFGLLCLVRPKLGIIERGLQRARPSRGVGVALGILTIAAFGLGVLHSLGVATSIGGYTTMAAHIGVALAVVPLLLWHVVTRGTRLVRADLGRRSLLRAGAVLGAGALVTAGTETLVRVAGLPGGSRRLTGSYETGSRDPARMPVTQWLSDAVPAIDPAAYALGVRDARGPRTLRLGELLTHQDSVVATIDCTGGWYAEQEWGGVWLSRLLTDPGDARSLVVRSVTGYSRRFGLDTLPRLLLATRVAGAPLGGGHGGPVRLVAPDHRGFWWVKWVAAVELDGVPSWWQSPFPLQ